MPVSRAQNTPYRQIDAPAEGLFVYVGAVRSPPLTDATIEEVRLDLVGGRPFWHFRTSVPPDQADVLLYTTFERLNAEFEPGGDGPIGVAVAIPAVHAARRPEAVWEDPRMVYAGALPDGAQLRIGYFDGADIAPREIPLTPPDHRLLAGGPRIVVFDEQDVVDAGAIIRFWLAEQAMDADEAQRRVSQVLLVALGDAGEVVAVATRYLLVHEQLGLPMWHGRVLVGREHRRSALAIRLVLHLRLTMSQRFVTGRDRRGHGILFEVENPILRRFAIEAHWLTGYTFIGERAADGAHIRVHWFPGASVPVSG